MIEWVPWIVWAEFVGVACVIVGAWGLLRLKRARLEREIENGDRTMFDPTTVRKNRTPEIEIRPICGYLTNDETLNHGEKCTQVAEIRFKWRDGFLYNCQFHAGCLGVSIIEKIEREQKGTG